MPLRIPARIRLVLFSPYLPSRFMDGISCVGAGIAYVLVDDIQSSLISAAMASRLFVISFDNKIEGDVRARDESER